MQLANLARAGQFLSTPSARRATPYLEITGNGAEDFYPRPPRGGRLPAAGQRPGERNISIHALREEGDAVAIPTTTPVWISIHALREEGDGKHHPAGYPSGSDFYPRPPRGGRHAAEPYLLSLLAFLSTPSARRATLTRLFIKLLKLLFLSTPSARRATV